MKELSKHPTNRVKSVLLLYLLFFVSMCGYSETADTLSVVSNDSLQTEQNTIIQPSLQTKMDNFRQRRWFQATYLGVPMIAMGLLEKHFDDKFRVLRNDFMPKFDYKLDNYTQIAPAAVMLGLKAAGVPSRSSWGRMIMSDAITITLMTGVVQGLKYTTNVTRPDGSNKQSFPSGHTATAFMTATMLSKEYGHISPWVSVGAYTIATATGLMRMANNKHWLSDVMVGAGFGILSTEFGYWITDTFMRGRGLNFQKLQEEEQLGRSNPSFFNLYMGFNIPLSKFDINNNTTIQTSVGTVLGVEGAYFFNQYIGIGGRSTFSNIQLIINDTETQDNTFNFDNFSIGPYFSLPLTLRWTLDTKLLATFTYYYNTIINNINIPKNTGWGIGTGLGINYHIRKHFAFGLFADHNIQPPYSIKNKEYIHTLTIGTKAAMRF